MKNILPLITILLLLNACDNTKIQLRAPEPRIVETKTDNTNKIAKDTVKTDSARADVKK